MGPYLTLPFNGNLEKSDLQWRNILVKEKRDTFVVVWLVYLVLLSGVQKPRQQRRLIVQGSDQRAEESD